MGFNNANIFVKCVEHIIIKLLRFLLVCAYLQRFAQTRLYINKQKQCIIESTKNGFIKRSTPRFKNYSVFVLYIHVSIACVYLKT